MHAGTSLRGTGISNLPPGINMPYQKLRTCCRPAWVSTPPCFSMSSASTTLGCSSDPSAGWVHLSGFSCTLRLMPAKWPPCSSTVCSRKADQRSVTCKHGQLGPAECPACSITVCSCQSNTAAGACTKSHCISHSMANKWPSWLQCRLRASKTMAAHCKSTVMSMWDSTGFCAQRTSGLSGLGLCSTW